jgi:hypothetical protein
VTTSASATWSNRLPLTVPIIVPIIAPVII